MSNDLAKAGFTVLTGDAEGTVIPVHFNPESLELNVTNNLQEQGEGDAAKQYVSQATQKLTLTLLFDTTHDGSDVRTHTRKLANLMGGVPDGTRSDEGGLERVPAVLRLDWGAFSFQGMIETYKETLDFWSWEGVPLRASVTLGLSKQDRVFEETAARSGATTDTTRAIQLPVPPGGSASDAARLGGDAGAARALALTNGVASLRAGIGGSMVVGGGLQVGASVSLGASVQVGVGPNSQRAQTTTRLQAAGGAFADLRSGTTPDLGRFRPGRARVGVDPLPSGTSFAPGGRLEGSTSGLSADVGQGRSLADRLRFGESS